MPKYRANIEDALGRDSLMAGITSLTTAFAEWEIQDGQGTRRLWSVLGTVYELGSRIEQNRAAKLDLIDQVSRDPDVEASPKWDPSKKGAHELLLVKLLSLREDTKAKKSQWYSAICAAKKDNVEPQQSSFVEFLESVGGIDKARKLNARPAKSKPSFEELAQWAQEEVDPDINLIQTPRFHGQCPELPGEIGLVLVSGKKAGGKARPITTIADPALVSRAIEWLIKAQQAMQAAMERSALADDKDAMARMVTAKREIRAQFRKDKKLGRKTVGTFREYVWQKFSEVEQWSQIKDRYPHIYDKFEMSLTER